MENEGDDLREEQHSDLLDDCNLKRLFDRAPSLQMLPLCLLREKALVQRQLPSNLQYMPKKIAEFITPA